MDIREHRQLSESFSIRTAGPADMDAVSTLLEESYSCLLAASYDGNILRLVLPYIIRAKPSLLASGTYYVAETEPGMLVGCGGWTAAMPGSGEIKEGEGHIRHFAVHPEWTRRGIGACLIARCILDARKFGVRKLQCLSTLNAEPFYRASGFQTIGPIDVTMASGITFAAVSMEREIA